MKSDQPAASKKMLLVHPFLLAVYPIVFLYSHNMDEASPGDLPVPILLSLAFASVIVLLARAILKNRAKAAVVSTLAIGLFFSYGHVFDVLRLIYIRGYSIAHAYWMFPLWVLLMVVGVVLTVRTLCTLEGLNRFLNAAGTILLVVAVLQIGLYAVRLERVSMASSAQSPLRVKDQSSLPDIYYIILDAYARADVLKDKCGIDNSDTLNYLRGKGFYIADKSRSNYMLTKLSLPSSLNFEYLQDLAKGVHAKSLSRRVLYDMLAQPQAIQMLKQVGYRYVFFPSGYGYALTDQPLADVVLRRKAFNLSEFNTVLWNSTMLRLTQTCRRVVNPWPVMHYRNTVYALDQLKKVPEMEGPTVTFAHITVTHPPFVFDAKGRFRNDNRDIFRLTEDEYSKLYCDSIVCMNRQLKEIVSEILGRSKRTPIIVLQADHGIRMGGGCAILNAYLLPDGGDKLLYPTISPVNTFRVIFNHYFGADYPLLEDVSYAHEFTGSEFVLKEVPY